ncbi:MAG: pirin family protein [Nitrospinales bacterium]
MIQNSTTTNIKIYPPEAQAVGQFDGGRITEIKPIPFPGESPNVGNTGPLFYWAWASAKGYGRIGLHPHQAFEIVSYAIEGEIGHYDTLGNISRVKAGGAQVIQAGTGVSHEEETVGDHNEFFQIWFEPDIRESIYQVPTYNEYSHDDFRIETGEGVSVKYLIGEKAPIEIQADADMKDITIQPGFSDRWEVPINYIYAMVVIAGKGLLVDETILSKHYLEPKYLALIHSSEESVISVHAEGQNPLRIALIKVPSKVNYPLYRKR